MHIEINEASLRTLLSFASLVEARDGYTGGHLWRVSQFSKILAKKIGLSENEVVIAALGGFLHDLGKIGIPDSILLKPSKLTKKEREVMQTHPTIGYSLIQAHPLAKLVQDAIYHHHEWCNGKGYPQQLCKEELSIYARIVGIADAFDAMTSQRPYRNKMTINKALSLLNAKRDQQFEGDLIDLLSDLGATGALAHIVGHSAQGIPLLNCYECGPIIVVDKEAKEGDYVFCHGCTGKFQLHLAGDSFEPVFVDEHGRPDEVMPQVDSDTISELLQESVLGYKTIDSI